MVPSLGIAPNIIIIHSCLPSHKLSLVNRCLKYAYIHSVSIFTMLGSAQYIRFTSRYLIFDSTSIDFLYILYIYSLFLEKSPTGMDKTHQDVLRKYAEEFNIKEKLDVETMVNSLVQEGVLHYDFAREQILKLSDKSEQIKKLMLDILPKSGHKAFEKFCFCLARKQPAFAQEWKNMVKGWFQYIHSHSILAVTFLHSVWYTKLSVLN